MLPPSHPSENDVLSVTQLSEDLNLVLRDEFGSVHVEGELSNVSPARSGHMYFTLKDSASQVNVTMWRSNVVRLTFRPQNGMAVRIQGKVTFYGPRGSLQIEAHSLKVAGEGELNKAFEALKAKLFQEGLFDPRHKQPLPALPQRIGIITSATGAAIEDIRRTLRDRFPLARLILCDVPVQGVDAAPAISRAIRAFSALPETSPHRPDVLIVGRGGGSLEDLWAFNEEEVARAIFACTIPVVSAVGHEPDVTISDYVADARAATPTMAAKMVCRDQMEVLQEIRSIRDTHHHLAKQRIQHFRLRLSALTGARALLLPFERVRESRRQFDQLCRRIHQTMQHRVERATLLVEHARLKLEQLHPLAPIQRGFVLARTESGAVIVRKQHLHVGEHLILTFQDGHTDVQVLDSQETTSS